MCSSGKIHDVDTTPWAGCPSEEADDHGWTAVPGDRQRIQNANAAVAGSLRIPEGSNVIFCHEQRFAAGRL
jgi:hypothetical protein